MKLFEVLPLVDNEMIALVGAGGKSSLLRALAREAAGLGRKALLATTTKMFVPDILGLTVVISPNREDLTRRIRQALTFGGIVVAAAGTVPGQPGKLVGFDEPLFSVLADCGADLIVVEADGAATRPFKAPAGHEPVIPAGATKVIPVVGLDCIGKPLNRDHVHRPEEIQRITGLPMGEPVTPAVVAAVLAANDGYRKGVPPQAAWIPFLNKAETPPALSVAREVAKGIREIIPATVLIGSARNEAAPVKEVVS